MREERDIALLYFFSPSASFWDPLSKVSGRHEKEQPTFKCCINYLKFTKYFLGHQANTIGFRLEKIKNNLYRVDEDRSLKGTTFKHIEQKYSALT